MCHLYLLKDQAEQNCAAGHYSQEKRLELPWFSCVLQQQSQRVLPKEFFYKGEKIKAMQSGKIILRKSR